MHSQATERNILIQFGRDTIDLRPGDDVFRAVHDLTMRKGCPQKTDAICTQIYDTLRTNIELRPQWQKDMVDILSMRYDH